MKKILDHKIRKKIYNLISKNPGIHLSKIAEVLNIRISLIEYHLVIMEEHNLVVSIKEPRGYHRRYYVEDSGIGTEDKKILALLRQDILLKIVLLLARNPRLRHKNILENLDISPSTLSYHINRLVENEIIEVTPQEMERGYRLKDKKKIVRLLLRYELHVFIEEFRDIWKDLQYYK